MKLIGDIGYGNDSHEDYRPQDEFLVHGVKEEKTDLVTEVNQGELFVNSLHESLNRPVDLGIDIELQRVTRIRSPESGLHPSDAYDGM